MTYYVKVFRRGNVIFFETLKIKITGFNYIYKDK